MSCQSHEYQQHKPFIIFMLIFYVMGLPITLLILLIYYRRSLKSERSVMGNNVLSAQLLESSLDEASMSHSTPSTQASPPTIIGYSSPNTLSRSSTLQCLASPLLASYRKELWYWQLVVVLRRLTIALISVYLFQSPRLQAGIYTWLHLFLALLQHFTQPYEVSTLNQLEFVTQLLLAAIAVNTSLVDSPPPSLAINVLFLCFILPFAAYLLYLTLHDTIRKLLKKLNRKKQPSKEQHQLVRLTSLTRSSRSESSNPQTNRPTLPL